MTTDEPATEKGDTATVRLLGTSVIRGIRTPLHSLLGFSELLVMSDLDDSQRQLAEQVIAGAEEVLTASNRLSSLLGVLADAGQPAPKRSFELRELLGEVTSAVATNATVGVQIHPQVPTALIGDREALVDTLLELATNTVAHGKGPIGISVEPTGPGRPDGLPLRFSVTDAGPGLPADVLDGLHAPHPLPPADGRGFGLYLARLLTARLGGRLSAARGTNGGTVATLAVTLKPAGATASTSAVPVVSTTLGLRVLLVEDNTVNRILAQRQFARLGHALDTATNGASGVAAATDGDYDVVLMDRHLPDIDGIEATRRIRTAEADLARPRRVRIIAVTADVSPGTQEECLAAGMDGFLTKPVDLERLRVTLASVQPNSAYALVGLSSPENRTASRPLPVHTEVDVAAMSRLTDELDGDRDAAVGLMRAYLDELPGRRLRLQGAVRRSNTRQTVAAADSLRSASITVGAVRVARACTRIGGAAQIGDLRACHDALPELLDACDKTVIVLGQLSDRIPTS